MKAYDEYVKNENDLKRLEGSMQAIEYVAYGKMPGDGNHDKFKDHRLQYTRKILMLPSYSQQQDSLTCYFTSLQ